MSTPLDRAMGWLMVALGAGVVGMLAVMLTLAATDDWGDRCREAGGVPVETAGGFEAGRVCVKAEELHP